MKTKQEVISDLTPMLRDILDTPDLEVTESLSAHTVPEWDSLNHMRILSAVEQQFSIRLASAEIESIQNVGDFAELIASKLPS